MGGPLAVIVSRMGYSPSFQNQSGNAEPSVGRLHNVWLVILDVLRQAREPDGDGGLPLVFRSLKYSIGTIILGLLPYSIHQTW